MDKERKLIIAGNWKMNKTVAEALDLVQGLKRELANVKEVDIVVCPPFTALSEVSKAILDSNIRLGAQNMSEHNFGAFTGEIAAGMLKEFSVRYVILGHSERRQYQKESDELIAKKARPPTGVAQADRLRGRNLERTRSRPDGEGAGNAGARQPRRFEQEQMEETIVAYEPVWAIGTGKTATTARRRTCMPLSAGSSRMFDETVAATRAHSIRWQRQVGQRPRIDEPAGRGWRVGRRGFPGNPRVLRISSKTPFKNEKNYELIIGLLTLRVGGGTVCC